MTCVSINWRNSSSSDPSLTSKTVARVVDENGHGAEALLHQSGQSRGLACFWGDVVGGVVRHGAQLEVAVSNWSNLPAHQHDLCAGLYIRVSDGTPQARGAAGD